MFNEQQILPLAGVDAGHSLVVAHGIGMKDFFVQEKHFYGHTGGWRRGGRTTTVIVGNTQGKGSPPPKRRNADWRGLCVEKNGKADFFDWQPRCETTQENTIPDLIVLETYTCAANRCFLKQEGTHPD